MNTATEIVFVVDDEASVRTGLARLLRVAGFAVETFGSAEAFLSRTPHEGIGCIVLDLAMPSLSGLDLQQALAERGRDLPVVFLTGHGDIPASVQAMKQGATDFLTKPVDEAALVQAVEQALATHRTMFSARAAQDALRRRIATLSPREAEVMRLVIAGLLNKQIADRLGVGEKTVKVHRGRVMEKLGAKSVAELVRLCATAGIEPDPLAAPSQS